MNSPTSQLPRSPFSNVLPWAAVVAFGLLAVWVRRVGLLPGDEAGLQFLQSYQLPGLRLFARLGTVPLVGIVAMTLVVAWACRQWLRPLPLVAVLAGGVVLEETLKVLVHRARPTGQGLGFPSGHAIASLTLTLLVWGSLWRVLTFRGRVAIALVGVIFVIGVSAGRAAAGLHWPSDVVGGWLVALAYGVWMVPFVRKDATT